MPLGHSSWARWAMPLTSLMQQEQHNTIFEQWLAAYEIHLMQVGTTACKGPDKPEQMNDEKDPSPEATSD